MGRAKTEKFPIFAGFSLDPKTHKMSAGYIIGISVKPADFGLTGSEDNATMAAAVVRSLEAQGAAEATARAEAAEQRAEALAAEVARLRADRAVATTLAIMAMGPDAHEVLPHDPVPLLKVLRAECLAVLPPGAQSGEVAAYVRAMCGRIEDEAQPAEVPNG